MAILILKDVVITINAVTLTDHGNQITLNYEKELKDATVFGNLGRRNAAGTLQTNSCDIELLQDMAAASVEATLYPLVGEQTTVTFKPTSAATSATNPLYTLSFTTLGKHNPAKGSVGEISTTTASFQGGELVKTII